MDGRKPWAHPPLTKSASAVGVARSVFYQSFLVSRRRALVSLAKKETTPKEKKCKLIRQVLESETEQAIRESLEFGLVYYSDMEEKTFLAFLLQSPGNLQTLAEWAPGDKRLALQHFLADGVDFKAVPCGEFRRGLLLILKADATDSIKHPTVQSIAKDLQKCMVSLPLASMSSQCLDRVNVHVSSLNSKGWRRSAY